MRTLAAMVAAGVGGLALAAGAQGKPKPAKPAPAPAAAAAPAPAAPAAPASGGMIGFNSNAPVDATADTMEQFREQHLTIMRGNVEVIQGDVRIRTPELKLFSTPKPGTPAGGPGAAIGPDSSFGAIDKLEAAGPVYYVTPTQQAKADHAFYDKAADTITMVGNVIVTQDKNIVTGDRMVIEQKTGHATLISNATGLNKPQRVRGVFYPQQAAPPAPAGAPAAAGPAAAPPAAAPPKRARKAAPPKKG